MFGTDTSALSRFRDLCIGIEGKVSFFESEDSFRVVAQYIGHRYRHAFDSLDVQTNTDIVFAIVVTLYWIT